MWSGSWTVPCWSFGERRAVGFCLSGRNGRSTALSFCGVGCTTVPVPRGCAGTIVGRLLGCTVGAADGGSGTPQAAHVSMTIPVMTRPAHRGKACTWNPLLIQVLANHHSTHRRLHTQDREE